LKEFLTVDDADFAGLRVLVRVDFNVPLESGRVRDDTRIREALPTIRKLVRDGARVILCSHLGRPGGKRDPTQSLAPVADHADDLLGQKVQFVEDCMGPAAEAAIARLRPGEVLLLENLRFHKAEEENNPEFAHHLAHLADAYVNDAFGTAHRAHASTAGVADHLPSYAGYLMKKELDYLGAALRSPVKPFVAVLGGSKISGKIDVIKQLLPRVDHLLIGGAMAFTFSRAQGGRVGDSLVEADRVELARQLLAEAKERGAELVLPLDVVASQSIKGGPTQVVPFGEVPDGWKGVDIGPKTVQVFSERIARGRTILVNGPMGVFEVPEFASGTRSILQAVAASDGTTIVGGRDGGRHACQHRRRCQPRIP
jgi:phosphoglycerate kinase